NSTGTSNDVGSNNIVGTSNACRPNDIVESPLTVVALSRGVRRPRKATSKFPKNLLEAYKAKKGFKSAQKGQQWILVLQAIEAPNRGVGRPRTTHAKGTGMPRRTYITSEWFENHPVIAPAALVAQSNAVVWALYRSSTVTLINHTMRGK
ncbi:hypothetical protein HAX54_010378, partial [Datura stramonium]|nr:hypothetical protein [Datura stramonium]